MSKFRQMKFRVHSPAHSRKIQETLFQLGYGWFYKEQEVAHTSSTYLYTNLDGSMMHGMTERTFQKDPGTETLLKDLLAMLPKSPHKKTPEADPAKTPKENPMHKFQVGDKVIGNEQASRYVHTRPGAVCEVVGRQGDTIWVKLLEGLAKGEEFQVDPSCFDLKEAAGPREDPWGEFVIGDKVRLKKGFRYDDAQPIGHVVGFRDDFAIVSWDVYNPCGLRCGPFRAAIEKVEGDPSKPAAEDAGGVDGQTLEELVAENLSLKKQLDRMKKRLERKQQFYEQNAAEIRKRIEGAV